ncbi:hypothetical protein R1flu_010088 [Riccia fluitans]|uniref:Uncharacterized protein n=1 Tax=Riccia fluitans TaxID=41844 RepID=A0ABD1Z401_9MARC
MAALRGNVATVAPTSGGTFRSSRCMKSRKENMIHYKTAATREWKRKERSVHSQLKVIEKFAAPLEKVCRALLAGPAADDDPLKLTRGQNLQPLIRVGALWRRRAWFTRFHPGTKLSLSHVLEHKVCFVGIVIGNHNAPSAANFYTLALALDVHVFWCILDSTALKASAHLTLSGGVIDGELVRVQCLKSLKIFGCRKEIYAWFGTYFG